MYLLDCIRLYLGPSIYLAGTFCEAWKKMERKRKYKIVRTNKIELIWKHQSATIASRQATISRATSYNFNSVPWFSLLSDGPYSSSMRRRCTHRNRNTNSRRCCFVLLLPSVVTIIAADPYHLQHKSNRKWFIVKLVLVLWIRTKQDDGNAKGEKKNAKIKTYNEFGSQSQCHSSSTLFDRWRRH